MRALHIPTAGAAAELGELPTPTAGEGTVLIRVKAVGLNALDNGLASGMMAGIMPHGYPLVLSRDAAGVVEAMGDGVIDLAVGDEVVGHVPLVPPITMGTLAEYPAGTVAASVAKKPAGLDDVTAAALPLAGAAAAQSVDAVQPHSRSASPRWSRWNRPPAPSVRSPQARPTARSSSRSTHEDPPRAGRIPCGRRGMAATAGALVGSARSSARRRPCGGPGGRSRLEGSPRRSSTRCARPDPVSRRTRGAVSAAATRQPAASSVAGRLARLGCTRIGSPGILG